MSILIVDDDLAIRDSLRELLEDEGYRTVTVSNGMEALSYLERSKEHPCLILLDLMMPGLDGWEFRNLQKSDPALAAIPVAIISAAGNIHLEASVLQAEDYLMKPLDVEVLLSTIRRYCTPQYQN